ncbi:DUF805 domain-containing protein [Phaeobacter marinintestinus]|uniref:DUF805 domain-containing protein n=1 Tax=Falsiphaeobacter marinintestinus TaxID=1492905 RepID=UPI0011B65BE7|nr:DUF805 domain-containing protein [Phaeobacter marinintestinus]
MTFTDSVKTCFSKYVTFSGRASRPEYWWFFLFVFIAGAVANVVDYQFFSTVTTVANETGSSTQIVSNAPVGAMVSLVVFLPHLAVAWRRMHDTGRSGLFALFPFLLTIGAGLVLFFGIGAADAFSSGGSMDILFTRLTLLILIPTIIVLIVSPLLVLWWLTRPSQPGENKYGPNPHEALQ